jgi:putative addiction module killer protein
VYEVRNYCTPAGRDVFAEWRNQLRDIQAKAAIIRRINRIEQGNFGDHKYLTDGVSELRIDLGPGYRIYYAITGNQVLLLLCGGDKRTQENDIKRACAYWQDWQTRLRSTGK